MSRRRQRKAHALATLNPLETPFRRRNQSEAPTETQEGGGRLLPCNIHTHGHGRWRQPDVDKGAICLAEGELGRIG